MFEAVDALVNEHAELEQRHAHPTIHADVCSQCHAVNTGKQTILDTGGRVARFEARYAKKAPAVKK